MAITYRHLEQRDGTTYLAGTRIRVYNIMTMHQEGDTPVRLAQGYHLPVAAVYEALAYAADHPEEMEAIRREEHELTVRHMKKLPKEIVQGADLSDELRRDLGLSR